MPSLSIKQVKPILHIDILQANISSLDEKKKVSYHAPRLNSSTITLKPVELQQELNTLNKQERLKHLDFIPISEALGNWRYQGKKTRQEKKM
jgi:hypothetical protein